MFGQLLIGVVMGRKRVPATWTLTDADGRTLAFAEHSKQGFSVSRGEGKFSFRNKKKSAPHELFREGSDQLLGSTKGMGPPAGFHLAF